MVHVVPLNDLKPHDTSDKGNTCHCNPRVIIEPDSDIIVVAMDWIDSAIEYLKTLPNKN